MILNVAYSSDDNYAKFMGISMLSLLENNYKDFKNINIYILDNGISISNKDKLNQIVKNYNSSIFFIKFDELCYDLKTDNEFSRSSFGRIFLSRLKEVDKILYLDCDSIINGSFKELYSTDISKYYVAGVQDNVYPFFKEWIGLDKGTRYINAGFLFMNLKLWRKDNIEQKCLSVIKKYSGTVPHHDQGVINSVCNNNTLIIHPKYNFQAPMIRFSSKQIKKMSEDVNYYSDAELKEAKENPVFIHFTTDIYNRPWLNPCTHPMKNIFVNYMKKSPWKNVISNKKLPIKARIQKIFFNSPFFIYYIFISLVKNNKYKRMRKKYEVLK